MGEKGGYKFSSFMSQSVLSRFEQCKHEMCSRKCTCFDSDQDVLLDAAFGHYQVLVLCCSFELGCAGGDG